MPFFPGFIMSRLPALGAARLRSSGLRSRRVSCPCAFPLLAVLRLCSGGFSLPSVRMPRNRLFGYFRNRSSSGFGFFGAFSVRFSATISAANSSSILSR